MHTEQTYQAHCSTHDTLLQQGSGHILTLNNIYIQKNLNYSSKHKTHLYEVIIITSEYNYIVM